MLRINQLKKGFNKLEEAKTTPPYKVLIKRASTIHKELKACLAFTTKTKSRKYKIVFT